MPRNPDTLDYQRIEPRRITWRRVLVIGLVTFVCVVSLFALIGVLNPPFGYPRELSKRNLCADNIRGIARSMILYANDNADQFPTVPYAPYSAALNNPSARAVSSSTKDTLESYYSGSSPQAGSPLACLWIMVLNGQISQKLFNCRAYTGGPTSDQIQDASGKYFDNFQSSASISYSVAYPWLSDGRVGEWWSLKADTATPIVTDMAPLQGSGKPTTDTTLPMLSSFPRANSSNHDRNGQNVAFGDGHVDWTKNTYVGQMGDNMFTSRRDTDAPDVRGTPASRTAPAHITVATPPYDTMMLPVRDVGSRGM